ncbi:hypothetical protein NUW58_g8573 [Xylaria curta]|uniref:Uncharacterized protein n=1 Tax=Xylaria curta TaxID=42375 RepID=A0ACC1N6S4_9PEZI|nr:hypothetical protein NUW58_g8573 [Xylaria curta]
MLLLLFILTTLLGRAAPSPGQYVELGALKNVFHEMGIADPVTFKLVDRLVELAAIPPPVSNATNATSHTADGMQLYAVPQGELRCHTDKVLDYMSVMAAVAQLSQQCAAGNMHPRDNWYGQNDYWETTRVYVCNWGGTNDCRLEQMLEAIAEIWNYCKAGTVGGWWRTYHWKKGYGLDSFDKTWCDFE